MRRIKSLFFILLLAVWTLIIGVLGVFLLLTGNSKIIAQIARVWALGIGVYLQLNGIKVKIEGAEHLPNTPFILACKHQSAWETIFLLQYLKHPVYILKKELMYIPIYGWYLPLIGMIPIERGSVSALKKLGKRVKKAAEHDRVIVIFPEGTRVAPGENVEYKPGIYIMHKAAPELPIVPAALNSGTCWPRGTFDLYSGVITLRFLPKMQGNFNKGELLDGLKKIIDEATNNL